jgi:sugar phosphate isomerase/epimerase
VQFDSELQSGSLSVLDLAPIAVKHGARGVEYRDVYWKNKGKELPAARERLARLELVATYTTVTTLYNQDRAGQTRLLQDIEDAKALGSPLLRVQLGIRPGAGPEDAAIRDAARAAVEHAAHLGVKLALENNSRAPGEKLGDIRATLEEFDSPTLGTNMDFANYATTGQDPVQAIKTLGAWIVYVHAKDAKKTDAGWTSTYLGGGTLPIRDILKALDAVGRSFHFCFEFPGEGDPETAIVKSKAFLEANV